MDYRIDRNKNRTSPPGSATVQGSTSTSTPGGNNNNNNSTLNSTVNNPLYKDEREGCRSLICDANGIIIAEMVHRCMICAHISESINDARSHYQQTHFESTEQDSPRSLTNGQEGGAEDDDLVGNDDEEDDVGEDFDQPSGSVSNAAAGSSQGRVDMSMGNY